MSSGTWFHDNPFFGSKFTKGNKHIHKLTFTYSKLNISFYGKFITYKPKTETDLCPEIFKSSPQISLFETHFNIILSPTPKFLSCLVFLISGQNYVLVSHFSHRCSVFHEQYIF